MEPSEQPGSSAEEAVRRLRERVDQASQAAERLIEEAAGRAETPPGGSQAPHAGRAETPPGGWQVPHAGGGEASRGDLELLMQIFQSFRDLIPLELQRRLAAALRELLMALRALIDWYLERTEQRSAEPAKVEDIPIR
jgi:hypothetical protein